MTWSDGRMVGWPDGGMVGWSDGRMVGWSDGRMVGWSDGRMVGWSDGRTVGRPRMDTGPRRKQAPLRHDSHAAAMTEWKWYDGSRWKPTRKAEETNFDRME